MNIKLPTRLAAVLLSAALLTVPVNAVTDPVTRQEIPSASSKGSVSGIKRIDGRAYSFDNGVGEPFTGKVKFGSDYYYFISGSPWFGWAKISGSWYYFAPDNGGKMATGKFRTATGIYSFGSDGRWTGQYSKSAKANSDFYVEYTVSSSKGVLSLNTKTKKLINSPKKDGLSKYTVPVTITSKDKQIIYEMFCECALNSMKSNLDYGGSETISVTAKLAGGTFTAATGSDSYKKYATDKDVRTYSYFTAFMNHFITALPEYEASKAARNGNANLEFITDKKVYRYKSSLFGITGSNMNTDIVLSSKAEVNTFIKNNLLARKRSNFSYIKKLKSYDDAFFKNHVLLYSEALLPSGSTLTPGVLTYDKNSFMYSANISVKTTSSSTEKQYVIIAEVKKSKSQTGAAAGEVVLEIN